MDHAKCRNDEKLEDFDSMDFLWCFTSCISFELHNTPAFIKEKCILLHMYTRYALNSEVSFAAALFITASHSR